MPSSEKVANPGNSDRAKDRQDDRSKAKEGGREGDRHKESSSRSKDKERSSSSGTRPGSDRKASQTAAEIRAEEHEEFIKASVDSHGGWLTIPLTNISQSLAIPPLHLALILGSFFTLLLLISPRAWIPWISAPVVLLTPALNTLRCLSLEGDKDRRRKGGGGEDMAQWVVIWICWAVLGWMGEVVRVLRPGWRGVSEIGKVGAGVALAGPWFGKAAMKGAPSNRLLEAEKREQREEAARAEKSAERGEQERPKSSGESAQATARRKAAARSKEAEEKK